MATANGKSRSSMTPARWLLPILVASVIGANPAPQSQELAPRFSPSSAPFETRFDPRELTVQLPPGGGPYSVEVELPGANGTRTIALADRGEGQFTAEAPLLERSTGPLRLHAIAAFSSGSLAGEIADREVVVSGKNYKLSEIGWVDQQKSPLTALLAGAVVPGKLDSGATVSFNVGGYPVEVDLAAAQRVEFYPAGPRQGEAPYTVIVRKNKEEVSRAEGIVIMTEGPAETSVARALVTPPVRRPPLASDQVSVRLAAPAEDVVLGGGGRYLIFQLRGLQQLAIFDVNAGSVTRTLPLPSDNVRIAAGLEKLVVLLADSRQLQRWDLRTMEREFTATLTDLPDAPVGLSRGYASHGPLMVMTRRGPILYELGAFKPLINVAKDSHWAIASGGPLIETRASADGSMFTGWDRQAREIRAVYADLTGIRVQSTQARDTDVIPSSDGAFLFTSGGVYSSLVKLDEDALNNLQSLPAVSPFFFLGLRPSTNNSFAARGAVVGPTLNVYSTGDRRLLTSIPNLAELAGSERRGAAMPPAGVFGPGPMGTTTRAEPLPLDKRVFFIPAADLLITIADSRSELILRKVDLMAAIDSAHTPYLLITSLAPREVQRGQLYRYPMTTKSSSGGVTFKIESGPAGMWVSPEGLLTWIPTASAAKKLRVIVSARDRGGLEVYHDFTIDVR